MSSLHDFSIDARSDPFNDSQWHLDLPQPMNMEENARFNAIFQEYTHGDLAIPTSSASETIGRYSEPATLESSGDFITSDIIEGNE